MFPSELAGVGGQVDVAFEVEEGLEAQWEEMVPRELLAKLVQQELGVGTYALALHLVSEKTIQELNQQHRGIDAATDVLSFGLHDPDGMRFVLPPGQPIALGDVVICFDRALAQAEEYGHSRERELAYLAVHGTLHMLGYDHEEPEEGAAMRAREEEALAEVGLVR